jgi:hypothetical protein
MAKFGKKILSAFMEVTEENKESAPETQRVMPAAATASGDLSGRKSAAGDESRANAGVADQRFAEYFDKLFSEANIPGPDYYEFSRMIGAMQVIADEQSRYQAAFAGLQVQGLDKQKLLTTAAEYLRVLAADAGQFQKTVETASEEKVNSRTAEAEEKARRIQALSEEISKLQQDIILMQQEIDENREKLTVSSTAYAAESKLRSRQIETDIEKINHYIH